MNNDAFVPQDYKELHLALIEEQKRWKEIFSSVKISYNHEDVNSEIPLIHQVEWILDGKNIYECIYAFLELLKKHKPNFRRDVNGVEKNLTEELALEWFQKAIAVNEQYFAKWANERGIEEFIPGFISENSVKSLLQVFAEKEQEAIHKLKLTGACPCCGEPPRLSIVDEKGKKNLLCPRCHTKCYLAKLTCAFCGDDQSSTTMVLDLKENNTSWSQQIHICKECHNYTKLIYTDNLIEVPDPAILDLNSIHLDYIAQEKLAELGVNTIEHP